MLRILVLVGAMSVLCVTAGCSGGDTEDTPAGTQADAPRQAEEEDSPDRLRVFEEFGRKATVKQADAVAAVAGKYLRSVSAGDWSGACTLLSNATHGSRSDKECAKSLSVALQPLRDTYGADLASAEITRVRVGGGFAAVFYAVPDRLEQVLALKHERGAWRTGANLPLEG